MTNPTYYRVTINNITAPAPGDGFVDNNTIEYYVGKDNPPTTLLNSVAKKRANMRWLQIIQRMQEIVLPDVINNIVVSSANANKEATNFSFTVAYNRTNYLVTLDETSSSVKYLYNTNAIQRFVARGLFGEKYWNTDVYDPTDIAGLHNVPSGLSIRKIQLGKVASTLSAIESKISVYEINYVGGE